MKSKRLMSAVMAGVMAVTTAIVCPISASAEDTVIRQIDNSIIPTSELSGATKVKVVFNVKEFSSDIYATISAIVNGASWNKKTFATPSQYASGAGQDWQADYEVTSPGEQSCVIDFGAASWGYQVTLQTDNEAFTADLIKIDFLDDDSNVVATYDPNEPTISKDNFTYSTLVNESMKIGDSFTITYDSDNTPSGAEYCLKYVYTDSNGTEQYPYAVKPDGTLDNSSKDIVGVEVSKSTSGTTKTTYTFTAVKASAYPFKVNVEISPAGTWTDTSYPWFGDVSYKVLPSTHNITVDSNITNGTVTADKETAVAGEEVTLTVTPDEGYQLKADTLKVTKKDDPATVVSVTDNKFEMPDYDVEISAEFEAIVADSVSLNKTSTTITVGDTETLVATVDPATALDRTVTWKSSDTAVATVDSTGKVTAVKAGTATITATTSNGKTATCAVTVTDKVIPATAVTVDPTTAKVEVGSTVTITGTVTPADSTDKITWKSSDTAVATVDAAGKVTAVKEGTAIITATAGTKSATCTVTVTVKTVPATGVTVNPTSKTLEVGQTVTITGTVTPADSTDKITWKSSDTAVATVDETGKVTAVKEGTATITATAGTKSADCKITVKAASEDDTSDYALLSDKALKVTTKYEGYQIPVTAVAGDKITVTFELNDAGEYHQLSFKHAGEGWPALTSPEYTNEWNCVDVSASGTFTFTLNAEDAANITANNLVVSGYSVTYTKVELNADKKPSDDVPGYTGDVPADTLVKQTTPVIDGKFNTRFVKKVSEDDIKGATKIKFTLSNGTDTVEVESTKYFGSLSVNGDKVSAGDGYVFLSYTIKDIPEDITITCTNVEIIKE